METQSRHAGQLMYPPIECHAHGWLAVGDGHEIYWEECGNPLGRPALFVHGGPGAGCMPRDRRWFDPQRYRIVLFEQRGAGRSRPGGSLAANTTSHLLADIEQLRQHLRIAQWLLFGGSWGATLALAYAQQHPGRVSALVLRGVFTATREERDWLYSAQGAAKQRPAAWQRLQQAAPDPDGHGLLSAFSAQLNCGQAATELTAARAWSRWEQDLMAHEAAQPTHSSAPRSSDEAQDLVMARIGVHFAKHHYFLAEAQLLDQAAHLRSVPGIMVQGDLDLVTPSVAAVHLHRAWPGSSLKCIAEAGHASTHPAMAQQLIAATDHFANAR